VVIGIIAMLISILLPALNRARDAARTAQCMSNQRGIWQALLLYAHDNKESFPDTESAPGALAKYSQRMRENRDSVWECPVAVSLDYHITNPWDISFKNVGPAGRCFTWPAYDYDKGLGTGKQSTLYATYGINGLTDPEAYVPATSRKLTQWPRSAESIYLLDANDFQLWSRPPYIYPDDNSYYRTENRHSNGKMLNAVFMDGHVSTFTFPSTLAFPTDPNPSSINARRRAAFFIPGRKI
jgi:prepilin-type processing-associated H-X9-DG protein